MSLLFFFAGGSVAPNTVTIAAAASDSTAALGVQNTPPASTVTLGAIADDAVASFSASGVAGNTVTLGGVASSATASLGVLNNTVTDAGTMGLVAADATASLGAQNTPQGITASLALTTSPVVAIFTATAVAPPSTLTFAFAAQAAVISLGSTPGPTAPPATLIYNTAVALQYCTDEQIALRAWGDYQTLCPPSQKLAWGTDGSFGVSDPWTLTSGTAFFLGYGIRVGHVVLLKTTGGGAPPFGSQGELFAIDSVAVNSLKLRRLGHASGVGQPPSPAAGLTGVTFTVLTFGPQIDVASYDANEFFGIRSDNRLNAFTPDRLYDVRELQSFTVLTVLKRAYSIEAKKKDSDFGEKLAQVAADLEELRSRLVIRWGPTGNDDLATTAFGARTRR